MNKVDQIYSLALEDCPRALRFVGNCEWNDVLRDLVITSIEISQADDLHNRENLIRYATSLIRRCDHNEEEVMILEDFFDCTRYRVKYQ